MPARHPRRAIPLLALLLGFLLIAPAQALPLRQQSGKPTAAEHLVLILRTWLADLVSEAFRKNGAQIDPNGIPLPGGNPNGAATGPHGGTDNGAQIDPDG